MRSTAIALAVAVLLLVTVVMPAEYGVDPTGVGRLLGLKEMGEIKMQLARKRRPTPGAPAAVTSAPVSPITAPLPDTSTTIAKSDAITVTLARTRADEVKLAMQRDARVDFSWRTDRGVVNYDTHAAARRRPPSSITVTRKVRRRQPTPACSSRRSMACMDGCGETARVRW